jgi:hypothetical protein
MAKKNIEKPTPEKIKQDILQAWQEGHGGDAENVQLFYGEEGVVMLIPKAMYAAELTLDRASSAGGKIVDQYVRTLLHTVAGEISPKIKELTGVTIDEIIPLIDLRAGWAIALFRTNVKSN